jgi:hypothetical protein
MSTVSFRLQAANLGALSALAAVLVACGGTTPASTPSTSSAVRPTQAGALSTPAAPLATSPVSVPTQAGQPQGQAVEACSLLSDEEIEQIGGATIASKTNGSVQGVFANGCAWELDPRASGQMIGTSIELGVIAPGGRDYYDRYFAPFAREKVEGIGDEALRGEAGDIMAIKGDALVSVFVIAMGAGDEDQMTRDLLVKAISNLP